MLNLRNVIKNVAGSISGGSNTKTDLVPETLKVGHFMSADYPVQANKRVEIGSHIVGFNQTKWFGFGMPEFQANQGTIYVDLKNTAGTPVSLNGEVVLGIKDNNNMGHIPVYKRDTRDLRNGLSDITKRVKFPYIVGQSASFQDEMTLSFECETTDTVSATNSELYVDCSTQYVKKVA